VDLLLAYYKPLVDAKSNILKDSNKNPFTEDAVQLTLLMNNIALDQLKRFRHSYEYTQKEAAALAPIIRYATYQIGMAINSNKTLAENINEGDDFMARFKQALKTLGIRIVKDKTEPENQEDVSMVNNTNANIKTPEMIKENFYRIYNKLLS
jgi:hypothetical protein